MTEEDAANPGVELDGLSVDEAVDAVVAADESRDRQDVRETLTWVSEGGVVRQSALQEAMAGLSRDVSTARDGANMAAFELRKAENAAESTSDLDAVAARLENFETEVETVTARAADLEDQLGTFTDRIDDPDSLLGLAEDLDRTTDEAEMVDETATNLTNAIQDFREWLDTPEAWVNALQGDMQALEDTLGAIEDVVDDLSSVVEGDSDGDGEAATDAEAATAFDDPGIAWLDATLRTRVVALMVDDVRAELTDLRELAERGGMDDDWYPEAVSRQLDDLAERRDRLDDRLAGLAAPAWTDRFEDRLDQFEETLDGMEPPVDWVEIRTTLENFRVEPADEA